MYIKNYVPQNIYNISDNTFDAEIISIFIDGDKLSIELKGKEKLAGTYYFKDETEVNDFKNEFLIGDRVIVKGELTLPKNNTIPNTFNYKKYLLSKNIKYMVSIDSIVKVSSSNNPLIKLKNYVNKRIENTNNNEYLYAFVLGDGRYLSSEVSNNYRLNSITHLFSLSGLHVTIFAGIMSKILKKLSDKKSLILITLFLLLLCYITSFVPPIVRSVIFYVLLSLNKIYSTQIKPKYLLYVTFSITIFINPFYIYNLGYLLSFTATYFLILSNETIKIKNKILSLTVMSLVATLGSLPIIINNFYKINIIGFINNVFFVPYVSYIVYPVSLISFLIPYLSSFLNLLTWVMEFVSRISSNILNVTLSFSKMGIISIIIFYILLILFIKYRKRMLMFFLLILMIFVYFKESFNKDTCIYFIDVGQGDSALIKTKNNKFILIDTGGKELYYKRVERNKNFNLMTDSMIPFFNSIGVRKIDYLFLTHGDADHMGESINLVNNFKVNKVIFNNDEYNDLELELIKVLKEKKIPYYQDMKELSIDSNNLYFLNNKLYDNENDNSNVIYTELNGNNLLLMGDAGVKVENDIIKKYNLNSINILKIGHHGSKTSSNKEFINNVNPEYSIISVGKNNRYGHPNEEVLVNLDNSTIYRTDKQGSIMFNFKKNKLQIETCSP